MDDLDITEDDLRWQRLLMRRDWWAQRVDDYGLASLYCDHFYFIKYPTDKRKCFTRDDEQVQEILHRAMIKQGAD